MQDETPKVPITTDRTQLPYWQSRNIRLVIVLLGAVTLTCIIGGMVLVAIGRETPEPLWGLAGTSLGSLGTLLTFTFSGIVPDRRH